jgi:hypothetical protein
VCGGQGRSDAPTIAVDPRGTVHLVYAEIAAAPARESWIRYCRMKRGTGAFEKPRTLSRHGGERPRAPSLDVDGRGRLYVLWEREGGADRPGLAFSHSSDAGDSFAPAANVPGIAGPELGSNGSQQGVLADKLAVDDAGRFAIVNSTFVPSRASHVWLLRGSLTQ